MNNSVNKRFAESDLLHRCSIGVGYANGYVAVPPEHPLHGKHYDEANNVIDIHGGLTGVGSLRFYQELNELNKRNYERKEI